MKIAKKKNIIFAITTASSMVSNKDSSYKYHHDLKPISMISTGIILKCDRKIEHVYFEL